jgi:mono/diheme cytochrome c family protein
VITGFMNRWLSSQKTGSLVSSLLKGACLLTSVLFASGNIGVLRADEGAVLFQSTVLPALESHCYDCHSASADRIKGGLLLDRKAGLLQGGESGPAMVPGAPQESLLIKALRHQGVKMPPKGDPLSEETIVKIERWIELGAPDFRDEPMISVQGGIDFEEGRKHWAFQNLNPSLDAGDGKVIAGSIDAFIEHRLEEADLKFATEASKHDLVRRVYFDLTGLPPTSSEYKQFMTDGHPDAYRRLVDRLLASPRFGERQSLPWLDVVRFAESEGFEYDRHLPDAWRYRDYVIQAFNADKPYDDFLSEQLAGDELDADSPETLSAAIFHRLGPVRRNAGNPDIALSRNEVLTERTDVIGTAMLGLTVGCARCHDHKFDPISQRDYYQLQAYLAATAEHNVDLAEPEVVRQWTEFTEALDKKLTTLRRQVSRAKEADRPALQAKVDALEATRPDPIPRIPTIRNDAENVTQMHVLKRGIWERKGDPVGMKPLDVLVDAEWREKAPTASAPRTQLAHWISNDTNPLTARVMVNRIWQHYFGTGLVSTANDFGKNGMPPSHPCLLDFLAAELIRHDWQMKPIHRMILLSRTYQQTGRREASPQALAVDPDNRLQWRHTRRRLTGEELRDSMLQVAGVLNDELGGASVMLPVEKDLIELLYKPEQWQVTDDESQHFRRSVYLIAKRNLRLPFMEAFDQPALLTSCYRRESSTHAPQALELLNGRISNELAQLFGQRVSDLANGERETLVFAAYRFALNRQPNSEELRVALDFLADGQVTEFALALFNLNEFMYVF